MARTRALVALSAIFIVPLAASLVLHHQQTAPEPEPAVAPAPVFAPAPAVAPEPACEPAPAPEAAPAPEPEPGPAVRDPGEAMLLHDGALVVSTDVASSWASGRLTVTAEPGRLVAQRSASWDGLPESARALADAAVVVYDGDGSACVATVSAPRLHLERTGEAFPALTGDDGYETFDVPADLKALRSKVKVLFEVASDRLLLATQRTYDRRPCHGAWARRADLPAPQVFGRRALHRDDHDALMSSAGPVIRAQPEFIALAASFAEQRRALDPRLAAHEPDWHTAVATHLVVTRWDEVGGPRQLVSVELRLDREPCTDAFTGGFALLLEQGAEGLTRLPQAGMFGLTALMDIDRDGTLEGVTESPNGDHNIEAEGPRAATFADTFMIEYVGCPC